MVLEVGEGAQNSGPWIPTHTTPGHTAGSKSTPLASHGLPGAVLPKLFLIEAHLERGALCLESRIRGGLYSKLEAKALRAEWVSKVWPGRLF